MQRTVLRWSLSLAAVALLAGGGAWWAAQPEPAPAQTVSLGAVEVSVFGSGTVQARVPVTVTARIGAQVASVHVDHGERVRRGALLAVLDDREPAAKRAAAAAAIQSVRRTIEAAEASLAKARADLALARSRQRREADLFRAGFISGSAYDTTLLGVKAAEAAVENAAALLAARRAEARGAEEERAYAETVWTHTRVTAPMDGLVIQRSVEVGSGVAPGTPLFRLVDPSTLWVAARIDEALVGRLAVGQAARIRMRSGEEHAGHVARISRQSDAATRELDVYVAFDTPPERFAIDQEAEVSIAVATARGPSVPAAALVQRDGRPGVIVLREGRKVFQPVRIAASDGRVAIIAEGVAEGAALAAWTSP